MPQAVNTLYVVATPIGNLSDITLRAIEILRSADYIACEDTRVTKKLLDHYKISKPLVSFHHHSPEKKFSEIAALLKQGKNIALVSDAGTPGISDPGGRLIEYLTNELGDKVKIIPIPGPAAFAAALSVSGFPAEEFTFLGFPPHKKGRQTFFKRIALIKNTAVFYESPHRILKALELLKNECPDRPMVVCRELTKIYEEIIRGTADEILNYYQARPEKVRGEFAVVLG
ncbi:16S rRNA (cytidine(1402)-2'-O)-methyltransferase [Patescibacteria group bacterium]|nr:MAG: 16S rRNA (cytidine(1402)-2'-O)-methyltransferase [Patescibacteria group bacterium]